MKKTLFLFLIIFSTAFATDETPTKPKTNYTYVKIGGSLVPHKHGYNLAPTIVLGDRFKSGYNAVDISVGGGAYDSSNFFFLPKILYLYYFTPDLPTSFYAGAGLSCGKVSNSSDHKKFKGILGEAAVGYEWIKTSTLCSFVELTLSQSAIPLGNHYHQMPPVLSLGFGVGF